MKWSRMRESNPRLLVQSQTCYHYTKPECRTHCEIRTHTAEALILVPPAIGLSGRGGTVGR
jgi:hypothetical protein